MKTLKNTLGISRQEEKKKDDLNMESPIQNQKIQQRKEYLKQTRIIPISNPTSTINTTGEIAINFTKTEIIIIIVIIKEGLIKGIIIIIEDNINIMMISIKGIIIEMITIKEIRVEIGGGDTLMNKMSSNTKVKRRVDKVIMIGSIEVTETMIAIEDIKRITIMGTKY